MGLGPVTSQRCRSPGGAPLGVKRCQFYLDQNENNVAKALAAKQTPSDIIDDLYLRCLSRKPTATEKEKLMPFFGDKDYSETDVLNDLFWAILNSKEFIFNH